jgi:hypothetical protein
VSTLPTGDQIAETTRLLICLHRTNSHGFSGAVMLANTLGIVQSGPKHMRDMCGALTYISDLDAAADELARRILLPGFANLTA